MQLTVRRELEPLTRFDSPYVLAVALAGGVAGYGLVTWASQQLRTSLGVTGMNAPTYWGAYIVNFVFFVGLSAGGIIVSGLVHAFNMERYRAVARIAEVVAIACILMAGIFITLDIGRPDRLWHLIRYGRWESPLIWDVIIITTYLAMALGLGYFSTRADILKCMRAMPSRARFYRLLALGYTDDSPEALRRDQTILRALAFASVPAAVLLHSVTAWIMGLAKATPGWHTALLAPVFVGSALASGLALVTLVSFLGQRLFKAQVADETLASLGRLLLLALPLLGYFLFSELLTVVYAQEVSPGAFFEELVRGDYALFFWFDLLVGLVAPLTMLTYIFWFPKRAEAPVPAVTPRMAWARAITLTMGAVAIALVGLSFSIDRPTTTLAVGVEDFSLSGTPLAIALNVLAAAVLVSLAVRLSAAGGVALASLLVVAGVLAERINIVLAPQFTRFSPHPDEIFAFPYLVAGYRPTWEEISIILGVYALGILGFLLFTKVFPLTELPEEVTPEPRKWPGFEGEPEVSA